MAFRTTLALLVMLGGTGVACADEPSPRIIRSLNDSWHFLADISSGNELAAPKKALWERVRLPHTWNGHDAFDKASGYHRGLGTYRRVLPPDSSWKGRRVFLYCEGANQVAEVFLNADLVGRHSGGYTAFCFDLTKYIRVNAPDTLTIRVDNRHDPQIPPLDADFNFYGGLYRDVWLILTDDIHIDLLDHAGPGVYLDTSTLTAGLAIVRVRARVVNECTNPREVRMVHRIVDGGGAIVAAAETVLTLAGASTLTAALQCTPIRHPLLWSPESPVLYTVRSELHAGGQLRDVVISKFGLRTVAVGANGFLLNGAPVRLVGTNRHQDFPELGNALPDSFHRRDVHIVKDNGFNFLRLAHYPQDPAVLDEADRAGLLLWEEIPVVNGITASDSFAANAERMLTEMIHQHYNHPSVVIWGLMNEPLLRLPDPLPVGYAEAVVMLARRLQALARREDPGRPTSLAISHGELPRDSGLSEVTDILGLNLYFGWYYGTVGDLGQFLDDLHTQRPDRPLLVSEYGAGTDQRVHTTAPERFDFSSQYGQYLHEQSFPQLRERPYLLGSAIWNQFDFGSSHRQDTRNALNQKGIWFFDRTPKDIAFYYKACLADRPVLHIGREQRERAGSRPEDGRQALRVYTNADQVELTLDGQVIGTQSVANYSTSFELTLRDGLHRIECKGLRGGMAVHDQAEIAFSDRTMLFAGSKGGSVEFGVNVGGLCSVIDPTGFVYESDRAFVPGSWGYVGGVDRRDHHRVYGSGLDPLYQSARDSIDGYRLDVPDGFYELVMGFQEPVYDGAGHRVFRVEINGMPVLSELDLAAGAGRWTAVEIRTVLDVEGGEGIHIRFLPVRGAPILSALRLLKR